MKHLAQLSCPFFFCKALLVNCQQIIMRLTRLHMPGLQGACLAWLTLPVEICKKSTVLWLKHNYPSAMVKTHGVLKLTYGLLFRQEGEGVRGQLSWSLMTLTQSRSRAQ